MFAHPMPARGRPRVGMAPITQPMAGCRYSGGEFVKDIRVCIVGAGSSYTPEVIEGVLATPEAELPIRSVFMQDIDARRLDVMAGLSRRMVRRSGRAIEVHSDTRLEPMLEGADFVITQIRVGGMEARKLDEKIPLKYGVIGQETTGPGGMCKALRTIPPMLEIVRAAEREAPRAFILNYTNPSGIVTEAVCKHTSARFIGLCSGIPGMQGLIAAQLAGRYPDLRTYCVGLNHLGFIHRFLAGRRDVTVEAISQLCQSARAKVRGADFFHVDLAEIYQAIPIAYVHYYLLRGRQLREQLAQERTRAQVIEEIEAETFRQAADPALEEKPPALRRRGGAGYANVTFGVMKAIAHDTGAEIVASTLNRGCVEGLPDDAAVEIACRIDARGLMPLPVGPIPLAYRGLVQAVKTYETLTVEAAVTGSKKAALQALLAHPLVGDLDVAKPLLDELIAAHKLDLK
jgi:6-phospho-beta-glucosidase